MNIRKNFDAILSYVDGQLLKGNFEFISCDSYKALVKVDGYEFNIWIANSPDDCCLADGGMLSEVYNRTTSDYNTALSKLLAPAVAHYRKQILKSGLLEHLKSLES